MDATVWTIGHSTRTIEEFLAVLSAYDIEAIAEVNADKFGHYTPGSAIPIIPEAEMREARPDFLVVFPWHFRDGIVERRAKRHRV